MQSRHDDGCECRVEGISGKHIRALIEFVSDSASRKGPLESLLSTPVRPRSLFGFVHAIVSATSIVPDPEGREDLRYVDHSAQVGQPASRRGRPGSGKRYVHLRIQT